VYSTVGELGVTPLQDMGAWKELVMASGKVKWFDNTKGYGFIAQENGKDIFVHHTNILGKGYKTLQEGQWVTYERVDSDKGPKAANVQPLRAAHGFGDHTDRH
jgi:cold shock protein